eukprot:CAMPEP_0201102734 /NCGR_PEP_ID=MMETSP0812-20130820/19132_1 /ASSEMBLY_ACC=CAM_ASM_000668 /TAXON_ID=98059 /ORGANISM="Dinobryon sp., Strain UTEXLB2267" /LENGTH=31 /DNA_ID= /DNA_START= /DNA_END= /DNA_ORIENTATION=
MLLPPPRGALRSGMGLSPAAGGACGTGFRPG